MTRAGQNRIYTPYMTVCLVITLPKKQKYTAYLYMANPSHVAPPLKANNSGGWDCAIGKRNAEIRWIVVGTQRLQACSWQQTQHTLTTRQVEYFQHDMWIPMLDHEMLPHPLPQITCHILYHRLCATFLLLLCFTQHRILSEGGDWPPKWGCFLNVPNGPPHWQLSNSVPNGSQCRYHSTRPAP